jgi:hypothetical protein
LSLIFLGYLITFLQIIGYVTLNECWVHYANDEIERAWKDMSMAYFETLPEYSLERAKKQSGMSVSRAKIWTLLNVK